MPEKGRGGLKERLQGADYKGNFLVQIQSLLQSMQKLMMQQSEKDFQAVLLLWFFQLQFTAVKATINLEVEAWGMRNCDDILSMAVCIRWEWSAQLTRADKYQSWLQTPLIWEQGKTKRQLHCYSQRHRKIDVRNNLWKSPCPTPCSKQFI